MTSTSYYSYVENPVLDGLELSVRADRVLRMYGRIKTLDDFMALTKEQVMALKGAGARTWREIEEIQKNLAPLTPDEEHQERWDSFCDAVGRVNALMERHPEFRTCDAGAGFLVAVQSGKREATLRMESLR